MAFCARVGLLLACACLGCGQDIAGFWRTTMERLAAEPIETAVKDLREPLPYKTYEVTYRSLGGARVRALLAMPIG
ncbi:MAG: acetylxylan esterase, partial [Bryobacterales bacterium]|nr:acetylxylan esterase [Bryobacterales bacterium]